MQPKGHAHKTITQFIVRRNKRFRVNGFIIAASTKMCVLVCVYVYVCVCVCGPERSCSSGVVDVLCSSVERIVQSKPLPSPQSVTLRHTQTYSNTGTYTPTHTIPPHRYGVSSFLLTMTDVCDASGLSVSQSALQGASVQRHAGNLQPVEESG